MTAMAIFPASHSVVDGFLSAETDFCTPTTLWRGSFDTIFIPGFDLRQVPGTQKPSQKQTMAPNATTMADSINQPREGNLQM